MEKWIKNFTSDEEKKKQDEKYSTLSKEEKKDLKKQKIKALITKNVEENKDSLSSKDFLTEILEFNKWLNNRNYIAGDLDKIEIWITNLNNKLNLEYKKQQSQENERKELADKYKEIPPAFLEDKIRIALNKKLKGMKGSSSDTYYLKKLKIIINEKLKEAEYYEILRKIIES